MATRRGFTSGDEQDTAGDLMEKAFTEHSVFVTITVSEIRRIVQNDCGLPGTSIPESRECKGCGDEIEAKRLKAVPNTSYCLECKKKQESGDLSMN